MKVLFILSNSETAFWLSELTLGVIVCSELLCMLPAACVVAESSARRLCSVLPSRRFGATILDANDISGEPIAVVKLPQRVPNGLHGNWRPMEV